MMKDVTILTFDDMEKIRHELDRMIGEASRGASGEDDAKNTCDWLVDDLRELREQFE